MMEKEMEGNLRKWQEMIWCKDKKNKCKRRDNERFKHCECRIILNKTFNEWLSTKHHMWLMNK